MRGKALASVRRIDRRVAGSKTRHRAFAVLWEKLRKPATALAILILMLLMSLAVPTYSLLSASWSGQVTGHVANAAISGEFTGTVGTFDLDTIAPGDSGSFELTISNTGDVTLDVAEPTTRVLPAYLTVTFTKPPPRPGFPAGIDPGESVTIDIDWDFDIGYGGPGDIDFSFSVDVTATQVP